MTSIAPGHTINILHISDLHFGDSKFDHEIVFNALVNDLKVKCQGASRPDLVIFSGDIAQAADLGNVYFSTYEYVLEKLLSATGCSEQRFFLAPGNHDAHRKYVEESADVQKTFVETLNSRGKLNDAYLSGGLEAFAKDKFAKFREINEFFGYGTVHDDGIVRVDQISDRAVEEVFVPPPMFKRDGETTEKDGIAEREDTALSMREILHSHSNLVLYGRKDYGKTTLLQQIAVGIMQAVKAGDVPPSVPLLIDFEQIKPGDRPIIRPLQASLVTDLPTLSLKTILENGYATILVDDVAFSSERKWDLLKKFIQEYPRNRFIFSSLPAHCDGIIAALSDDVVVRTGTAQHFEHVFLQQFNRSSFRNLVAKWDKTGTLDYEAVVNRLVSEMTSMSIPMTAVNGTILLVIYEEKTGFRPINRAALIEQFVEYALEKLAPEAIFRGSLDYKTKEFLLSGLAAHMAKADEYILTWNTIVEVLQANLNEDDYYDAKYEIKSRY